MGTVIRFMDWIEEGGIDRFIVGVVVGTAFFSFIAFVLVACFYGLLTLVGF